MPGLDPTRDLVSLDAERRIDAVCIRFEAQWRANCRPQLGDFFGEATGSERAVLLRELLLLDIGYRRRIGETPRPDEYQGQFSENETALAELLSTGTEGSEVPVDGMSIGERYTLLEKIGQGGMGVYRARASGANILVIEKRRC